MIVNTDKENIRKHLYENVTGLADILFPDGTFFYSPFLI